LVKTSVLEIVDASLDEIFGTGKKRMIYYYVERNFSLKREEIPENFGRFLESLEELFGEGAEVIKKVVTKKLEETLLAQGKPVA